MQNDELIWSVVSKHFCSFKRKTDKEDFCSNQYNVTGKCNRVSCPLANSHYGTVLEEQGKLYLCLKTVERAHLPSRLWEKIKLSKNIQEAKKTIEKHMKNVYPQHQIERCKRRTIKLKQMIDRMRKLELKPKEKLEGVKKKTERREATREKKALVAAHIEDVIEDELLRRLHQGVYGDLYNEHRITEAEKEENEKETAEIQEAKAAQTGAIRFEAAEESEEEEEILSEYSDITSESDEFSFSSSDSDSEIEKEIKGEKEKEIEASSSVEGKKAAKRTQKIKDIINPILDLEEITFPEKVQKKRKVENNKTLPLATLRRQAAKRKNTKMRIEYEEERAMAEEA